MICSCCQMTQTDRPGKYYFPNRVSRGTRGKALIGFDWVLSGQLPILWSLGNTQEMKRPNINTPTGSCMIPIPIPYYDIIRTQYCRTPGKNFFDRRFPISWYTVVFCVPCQKAILQLWYVDMQVSVSCVIASFSYYDTTVQNLVGHSKPRYTTK